MQWKAASRLQVIDLLSQWETPCQEDKESLLDTLEASILKGLDVLAEKNPRSTPVVVIDDLSSLWHASLVGLSQWLSWLERIHDIIQVDVNISYICSINSFTLSVEKETRHSNGPLPFGHWAPRRNESRAVLAPT
jgi:hypothetical protein